MNYIKFQNKIVQILTVYILIIVLASCENKIESIHYGQDECAFCTMKINDDKYSAMIVTAEGETYKFGSLECLTDFALVRNFVDDAEQSFMISDYNSPGNFIDTRKSVYVHNDNFPSPMGLNVMAFDSKEKAEKFMSENGGKRISWIDVIDLVRKRSE